MFDEQGRLSLGKWKCGCSTHEGTRALSATDAWRKVLAGDVLMMGA
jgi:hypothetical protein